MSSQLSHSERSRLSSIRRSGKPHVIPTVAFDMYPMPQSWQARVWEFHHSLGFMMRCHAVWKTTEHSRTESGHFGYPFHRHKFDVAAA